MKKIGIEDLLKTLFLKYQLARLNDEVGQVYLSTCLLVNLATC